MGDDGVIREANRDDLDAITAIEMECFGDSLSYSRKQLRYLLTKAHSLCLVEEEDGVRGFIIVLFRHGDSVAAIETLDVRPSERGKGIGVRLLQAAEEQVRQHPGIRRIRLEVSTGNETALALYRKAGYRVTGRLEDFYGYDHHGSRDAYRMVKDLAAPSGAGTHSP